MWSKIFVLLVALALTSAQSDLLKPIKRFKATKPKAENAVVVAPFNDPFDGIDYRLPNTSWPLSYDIWLSTDIHRGEFVFDGRVTIQIEVLKDTEEITLHIRQLTIVNVRLLREQGGTLQTNVDFATRDDVEFLIIRPKQPLTLGTICGLVITYTGELRDDDAGFYRSSYRDAGGNLVWLATTQFESTDARHAFPW